ncbi:MAG: hypothetical protein WC929_04870 [Bacilli bacterium]|jgi:hypothetical protein
MVNVSLNLEELLKNVNKTRANKSFVERFGKNVKAKDFLASIEKLNNIYGTDFYLEKDGHAFIIQGHREYGRMSRRNGILGQDIDLTMNFQQIETAGTEDTIKMIVDNAGNFIVVSLTKMAEQNQFSKENLKKRVLDGHNTIPYSWTLNELNELNAIIYTS